MQKGDKFVHTFMVSDDVYQGFLKTFDDRNPMHTDREFAISNGFKDVVMHGNILGGFVSYFVGETLPIKNIVIISQGLNFHKPFYINKEVTLTATIADLYESVNLVDFKLVFTNPEGVKVAKGKLQIKIIE